MSALIKEISSEARGSDGSDTLEPVLHSHPYCSAHKCTFSPLMLSVLIRVKQSMSVFVWAADPSPE